jgi:two-component system phosphate regulon sensor histidine kinase PhoR
VITDSHDRQVFSNKAARDLPAQIDGVQENEVSRLPQVAQLISETRSRSIATIIEDIRDERQAKTRHAEFVSSVCHELKTPMASIKAYVELLIDGDVSEPDQQQEFFEFIETQVDRLTRLVDNMLNLARIESGVIELKREDCELNEILDKAFTVVKARAEEKSVRLISELSELYLPVHPDQDLLGQAIINLLSNAIKYTPEGGEVRLRSRMDEGEAVIEVRDNGMGIPADALPHIFDRFYRVECNNKAAAGMGLGLALVHYILTELHNGDVSVESEVDEGTCFTARIPLGHRNRRPKLEREEPECEEDVELSVV